MPNFAIKLIIAKVVYAQLDDSNMKIHKRTRWLCSSEPKCFVE